MKSSIIYHSHSGKTEHVAEQIAQALGGAITRVLPQKPYSSLSVVPIGCFRALRGVADPVVPPASDLSGTDIVVIASPVWAGRPTPVINGAVEGMTGCMGKKVFLLVTCRDAKSGADALIVFKKNVEEKGCIVAGTAILDAQHVDDPASISDLIGDIRSAGES